MLARKGTLALKKARLDEAEEDFQALVVLKPDDEWSKGRLARTLTLRAQRSLGKNKLQAALADATAALEFAPDDTNIQLTLGRRAPGDGQARAGGRGVSARARRQAGRRARQARPRRARRRRKPKPRAGKKKKGR